MLKMKLPTMSIICYLSVNFLNSMNKTAIYYYYYLLIDIK